KVVVAHVLGHVDFFKHNAYFQLTNRQMLEGASVNAERIRHYEFRHGSREVESFLDAVLSIQEHVEFSVRRRSTPTVDGSPRPAPARETPYDDLFYVGSERAPEPAAAPRQVPREPERDLLLFIAEHARGLEDWQLDVVHIVRAEQLYFRPQMMIKIINEVWAAFCSCRWLGARRMCSSVLF